MLKALSAAAAAVEQAAEESPQVLADAFNAADDDQLHTLINMVIEGGEGQGVAETAVLAVLRGRGVVHQ